MYWPNGDNQNIDRLLGLPNRADARSPLLGWYLALGVLLLVGGLLYAITMREEALQAEVEADLRLAQTYAQPLVNMENVVAESDWVTLPERYMAIIVDPRGRVIHTIQASNLSEHLSEYLSEVGTVNDPAWIKLINRRARYSTAEWFITTDTTGLRWLHT